MQEYSEGVAVISHQTVISSQPDESFGILPDIVDISLLKPGQATENGSAFGYSGNIRDRIEIAPDPGRTNGEETDQKKNLPQPVPA